MWYLFRILVLYADKLWEEVERSKISSIVIVGDAFAKPMLESLNKAKEAGKPYDISSVMLIISSGVMWSSEVKKALLEHHDMMLMDTMGSTEGGMGASITSRAMPTETAKFRLNPGTVIVSDDGEEVEPGSGVMGKIGTSGLVPEGYYKTLLSQLKLLRNSTVFDTASLVIMQQSMKMELLIF